MIVTSNVAAARALRSLVSLPPGWSRLEGRWRSDTLSGGFHWNDVDDGNTVKIEGPDTLEIEHDGGVLAIERAEIVWGRIPMVRSRYELSARVARGDHVAVCGLVSDGGLRSQGTRPAVLIATSRHGRPLAYVRAVARGRIIRLAGVAISAIALCVEAAMWR